MINIILDQLLWKSKMNRKLAFKIDLKIKPSDSFLCFLISSFIPRNDWNSDVAFQIRQIKSENARSLYLVMFIKIVFKETAVWTHETKPLSREGQICWFRIIQEFIRIWNTRNRTSPSFKWICPLTGIKWKIKCFTHLEIGSLASWWIPECMISRRYQSKWSS